jgi:hypothetical protein
LLTRLARITRSSCGPTITITLSSFWKAWAGLLI